MLFYHKRNWHFSSTARILYGVRQGLQFDIDYKRLLELFARKGVLVRAFYYYRGGEIRNLTAAAAGGLARLQRLFGVTKPLKEIHGRPGPAPRQGQYGHRSWPSSDGDGRSRSIIS